VDDKEREELAAQSWLAEYQALRSEILTHLRDGDILIGINIMALGTIVGLAVSIKAPGPFLLFGVLSIISSCLGLVWVTKNRWNIKLYNYIRDKVAPAVRTLLDDPDIFKWKKK
jgi:hypothetical protein